MTNMLSDLFKTLFLLPVFFNVLVDFNRHKIKQKNLEQEFDFIIIGGGSAGAVVASRLSENPQFRVALIEAGGEESILADVPLLGPAVLPLQMWIQKTTPQKKTCGMFPFSSCPSLRGKVIGGSSSVNCMLYVRGNKKDFDLWSALGNSGWSYDEVLPFFKKSEDYRIPMKGGDEIYHGTTGNLTITHSPYHSHLTETFLEAASQVGFSQTDINGKNQTGCSLSPVTMRDGHRCSTAKAFLKDIPDRDNLYIILKARVLKILLDKQRKRAIGVSVFHKGRIQTIRATKEVILSAGAVNSPKILMLSGIGPKKDLEKVGVDVLVDLPGVGKNLLDHVFPFGLIFSTELRAKNKPLLSYTSDLYEWAKNGTGLFTSPYFIEGVAFFASKYSTDPDWPDVQMFFFPLDVGETFLQATFDLGGLVHLVDPTFAKYLHSAPGKQIFAISPSAVRAVSEGQVLLRSKNPFAEPIIDSKFFSNDTDMKVIIEGLKKAVEIVEAPAFKAIGAKLFGVLPGCENFTYMSDDYYECVIIKTGLGGFHTAGSCKMGPDSDPMAVVDSKLRLRGVENLRVADASIMPTLTAGNPNAPCIMIGEKAAFMIQEDHLQ